MILLVRFGEAHHVIDVDDAREDRKIVLLGCNHRQEINKENRHRLTLLPDDSSAIVGCYACREYLGLIGKDDEQ